jgi:hypothetical protein
MAAMMLGSQGRKFQDGVFQQQSRSQIQFAKTQIPSSRIRRSGQIGVC